VAALAGPVRKAVDDTRLVRTESVRAFADAHVARFACIRDVLASVPDRPTWVEPADELPAVEWYQRAIELGFGEVPFVARPEDAAQVLTIVPVTDGPGLCGGLEVRVQPR
jgi:hypothetical protein